MKPNFLRVQGSSIVDSNGKTVFLRGLNFGGWLMMEAYFVHAPNVAEQVFKKNFAKTLGAKALKDFEQSFRGNYITEADMKNVAALGANCVRLPFNCRLIETSPYTYSKEGVAYLDDAIRWAKKYKIWLILDMHAAPGAQNHDWHSDSLGKAGLWSSKENQKRMYHLWEFISDRYKDEPTIAGYDLLNEAITEDTKILNHVYKNTIKAVRRHDQNHILFIEGSKWAQDISILDDFEDDNWAYSIHFYEPIEYTFNFVPFLHYPLGSGKTSWDKDAMRRRLESFFEFAQKKNKPIFVGEFGVNSREGLYQENIYLRDLLKTFNDLDFHWTYWTYKAVKNSMFPDGIYSYMPNTPWVQRHGPKSGWETWAKLWPTHKKEMIESWKTPSFVKNSLVAEALKNGF